MDLASAAPFSNASAKTSSSGTNNTSIVSVTVNPAFSKSSWSFLTAPPPQPLDENIKSKYEQLQKYSSEYLSKNLQKLNKMIKDGIKEASLDEFKKIISLDKYPIIHGAIPINPFAENLVKLVKNVYKSLKNCYEEKTISKIILDNLNMFNNELEKLMDSKKELNEDERKQFKKDFTFIKKNIDNGEIDFKAFKKKLTLVYKKLLKGEDKEK